LLVPALVGGVGHAAFSLAIQPIVTAVTPAIVPMRTVLPDRVGEAKCGSDPTATDPRVAPVAAFNATTEPPSVVYRVPLA
jgi:hypothetical protein